jgi:membrane protein
MSVLAASGVFGQLQHALNDIWDVKPRPGRGVRGLLFARVRAFSMLLLIGVLLVASLGVGAAVTALAEQVGRLVPGGFGTARVADVLTSFAVTALLFALLFKVLPDLAIRWSDVAVGAAVSALLFAVGRLGIAWYLGRASGTSVYGAAGSLVVLLLWIYYSSQLLFFGAEFTQVFASTRGAGIIADAEARPVTERRRAQQGLAAVPPGSRRRRIDRVKRAGGSPDLGAASWGKGRTLKFLALLAVLTAVARRRG